MSSIPKTIEAQKLSISASITTSSSHSSTIAVVTTNISASPKTSKFSTSASTQRSHSSVGTTAAAISETATTSSTPSSTGTLTSSTSGSTVTPRSITSTTATATTEISASTTLSVLKTNEAQKSSTSVSTMTSSRSTNSTYAASTTKLPASTTSSPTTAKVITSSTSPTTATSTTSRALTTQTSAITIFAFPKTMGITRIVTTSSTTSSTTVSKTMMGSVSINFRIIFQMRSLNEAMILNVMNNYLHPQTRGLSQPTLQTATYQKLSSGAFAIKLAFLMNNVTMSENTQNRNDTYKFIQDSINTQMNSILQKSNAVPFTFPWANYTSQTNDIIADVDYIYKEGDISNASDFLKAIMEAAGLLSTTTTLPLTTGGANITHVGGGFPGWALAIIIPCGILLLLIPCWILLCCLLCGCCAAIKRRCGRRQSYNIPYRIHNNLF
ncbi:uncharacterized protein [Paramormyrops kingsleyae]|uniref:uncharacterized protein n=1 Tax=Paramormyrops kingsleyae TaxID=1676925 RepID=UPI003B97BF17